MLLVTAATSGCAEDRTTGRTEVELDDATPPSARLARVHVSVQAQPDELEGDPGLQIEARFVEYRGVDESFVRVRTSLPALANDVVTPGTCVATESLWSDDDDTSDDTGSDRELSLADVGDMWVTLGEREIAVPLALVPDFLEYVSGVEYFYAEDSREELWPVPDGTTPVTVRVDAVADEDVTSFRASTHLPPQLELSTDVSANGLLVRWDGAGDGLLTLDLTMYRGTETEGVPLTCVVPDDGLARFSLLELDQLGLGDGDFVRVVARRFERSTVAAGAFRDVELLTEVRAHATAPWSWLRPR